VAAFINDRRPAIGQLAQQRVTALAGIGRMVGLEHLHPSTARLPSRILVPSVYSW
jgi:hypothetical protein